MVNKDRIIPVTKVDLLSLYATIITLRGIMSGQNTGFPVLSATSVDGEFDFTAAATPVGGLCNQPVKSIKVGNAGIGSVFFIPDYDYEGIYVNGQLAEVTGDVVDASSANLYMAVADEDAIVIQAVTPTLV